MGRYIQRNSDYICCGRTWILSKTDIIFWFHMPLFFLIAGYLFKAPERKTIKIWCIKQVKALLIPCMFFYVGNMLLVLKHASVSDIIKKAIFFVYGGRMLPGVYWFITCLLLSRIIMALIEICVDSKNVRMAIYAGMYILAVIESKLIIPDGIYYYPNVPLYCLIPWNADVCLFAVPFMAIGKYIKERSLEKREVCFTGKSEQVLLGVSVVLFALFSALRVCNFYSVEINMKYAHYSNIILCAVLPLSAGVILIKGAKALANGGGCSNCIA